MKENKRLPFASVEKALDYIDDLAKQKPKVTGYLQAPDDKIPQWSVRFTKERENSEQED